MARRYAAVAALFIGAVIAGQSLAAANHTVTTGPYQRATQGGYTICGVDQLAADPLFGTYAFGVGTTTTYSSASSCSGSITSGASVRVKSQLFHKLGGSWVACSALIDSGYQSVGSKGVNSFNVLGCGSGEYLNLTQHGGWITGNEYPATHWPLTATHTGY